MTDWRRLPWIVRYRWWAKTASEYRRLLAQATHLHADLQFDGPVLIGPGFDLRMGEPGATLLVGRHVEFRRRFSCEISGTGRVLIGSDVIFAGMATIQCSTSIQIGDGAMIGENVLIADGNHRFRDPQVDVRHQGYDFNPVTIGRGAVVHTSCTVINDIGVRAVIGANSVVSEPIPPYSLAVGAPARVVEYFGPPDLRPGATGG